MVSRVFEGEIGETAVFKIFNKKSGFLNFSQIYIIGDSFYSPKYLRSGEVFMIEVQTKLLKETLRYPSELDYGRIYIKRSTRLSNKERYLHKIKEAGLIGENTVVKYLKVYGKEHWIIIRNMWFDDFGRCENDITLITNTHCYVFEVKNYDYDYSHCDGVCRVNNKKVKNSPVAQARKNFLNMKKICAEFSPHIQVKGALILSAIDQEVDIQSPVEDIKVISRNNLRRYIREIVKEEQNTQMYGSIDKDGLIQYLERYEILNPNLAEPIADDEMANLRKGICCANCGTFDLNFNNREKYIKCSCGFHEPREEAILRTICEYGVLNHDKDLTRGNLLEFFGGQISHVTLTKVLNKYFKKQSNGKYTFYINMKLPLEKIRYQFMLDLPRIHHMNDQNYQIYIRDR